MLSTLHVRTHVAAGDPDRTARRAGQSGEQVDGGRLARPIGPEQSKHLTRDDVEVDRVDRQHIGESFGQAVDFDHRVAGGVHSQVFPAFQSQVVVGPRCRLLPGRVSFYGLAPEEGSGARPGAAWLPGRCAGENNCRVQVPQIRSPPSQFPSRDHDVRAGRCRDARPGGRGVCELCDGPPNGSVPHCWSVARNLLD